MKPSNPFKLSVLTACVAAVSILCFAWRPLFADVYMSIDSNGVIHFTDAPTASGYRLYIKERPQKSPSSEKYDHLINEASARVGLPFHLLKALIKVESDFDSQAVSRAGAMGLMQIMPENVKALKIKDPFNPRENIMGGAFYLKTLMERFEGKLPLALAAYNAGPSMVDQYSGVPPIKETREYVEKVMKYYYQYKNI